MELDIKVKVEVTVEFGRRIAEYRARDGGEIRVEVEGSGELEEKVEVEVKFELQIKVDSR